MTGQCPVKVKQAAYKIGNQNTEFLIADYGSICFVQITQIGKVGKLTFAARDKPDNLEGNSTFTINSLIGIENEKVDVLARQIVAELNKSPPYKTLLLGYSCIADPPFRKIISILKDLGLGNGILKPNNNDI